MPSPHHRPEVRDCILGTREGLTLHVQQEWKETRWKRVTLHELGYVYQEGHDGMNCPNPEEQLELRVTLGADRREKLLVSKCGCKRG